VPRKYKYRRGKSSTVSTVPQIYALEQTIENMNIMCEMPMRLERGRMLFLLSMANLMRKEIQKRAPEVDIGGETVDYARDLRIAIVSGVKDQESVAIYFEHAEAELTEDRMGNTALFVRAVSGAPEWVNVLVRFGPWPASMLPMQVRSHEGKVIARKARPDELKALSARLYARRQEIEGLLARAGASNPKVEQSGVAVGVVIREDVGYNVLRKEFGFDGDKQEAHWRPALKILRDAIPLMVNRFTRYIMTGREGVFELPSEIFELATGRLKSSEPFQKELAPFTPTGG
jgi:hypothetical protein